MKRKSNSSLITITIAVLIGIWGTINYLQRSQFISSTPSVPGEYGIVEEVVDGDTLKVRIEGDLETVRLAGVDTPETKDPSKGVECYGPEATEEVKKLLLGANVVLRSDTKQPNRDRYERLLRFIYARDSIDVNGYLVANGYAKVYLEADSDNKEQYLQLEKEAQKSKLGMWSEKHCPANLDQE